MTDLLITRLKEEIKKQGFNYKSLSLAAGLGETSVRDIITRRALNPRRDTLQKIAAQLNKPLSYFLAEEDAVKVPMVGEIKAGSVIPALLAQVSEHRLADDMEMVEAPPELGYRNLVAVRVRGEALRPFMPDGTLVYYRTGTDTMEECLDNLCVVQIKNGNAVIRTLKPGMYYGTYHLQGLTGETAENTEIDWCARIRFIKLP